MKYNTFIFLLNLLQIMTETKQAKQYRKKRRLPVREYSSVLPWWSPISQRSSYRPVSCHARARWRVQRASRSRASPAYPGPASSSWWCNSWGYAQTGRPRDRQGRPYRQSRSPGEFKEINFSPLYVTIYKEFNGVIYWRRQIISRVHM